MQLPVEFQLLRDWQPRSRPSKGLVSLGEGLPTPDVTLLTPGAASVGSELMLVYVEQPTRVGSEWASARFWVTIEGMPIGDARPGLWWLGFDAVPSCVVHYPVVASNDNLMFKGRHSLLVRTVE